MHKLQYLKAKFNNSNAQGSEDWLEGRRFAFGGSEMACVLNKDPYLQWTDLVRKKHLKENYIHDWTEWGKLFEPVAKIFIEKERQQTIHDFSSIPHPYYPVCYSPDGILVDQEDLVLLEIKSPIYRGVKNIPDTYIHQVQTGLNIINCKHCLFAQFRFRRCALWNDPFSVQYDRKYHKEFRKRCPDKKPIAFGYLYWETENDLIDLSTYDNMIDAKPYKHPKIIINEIIKPNKGFILMWKLFEINYDVIMPDKNYLKDREEYLWDKYKELRKLIE